MADAMDAPAAPDPDAARHLDSITRFLTDGSIVRLCAAVSEITGARIRLLDRDGSWIIPAAEGDADPWLTITPTPVDQAPCHRAPIILEGREIGVFTLHADDPDPITRDHLVDVTNIMATLSAEFCHEAAEMRSRIRDLEAIFHLSTLLAETADSVDRLLETALSLALGVLELDAGSIVLFPEDADGVPDTDSEAGVVTRASVNLSEDWLTSPLPLSRGRVYDRLVLRGHTLAIPDLLADKRVLAPDRCEKEGVRSFLSAAMVHRDRAIGVIRLYGREAHTFTQADQRLVRSIGEQAATAVSQARLLEVERREQGLERQLRLASDVQRRMQPRVLPAFEGLDVAVRSEPSSELGGDIHDVFILGPHDAPALGMVVGDVVGKGVPAALLMSAVRASLRAHATDQHHLEKTMSRTNRDMCRDSMPNEFTTLWFGAVDPGTRTLRYCSAGHDPPLLIRPKPGSPPTRDDAVSLRIGGLVLGINPEEMYESISIDLRPGDVLIAYTDGLTDARNFQNEKWGWGRMVDAAVDVLTQHPAASASMVLDNILWSLRRFVGLRRQIDDETMIVLRVAP